MPDIAIRRLQPNDSLAELNDTLRHAFETLEPGAVKRRGPMIDLTRVRAGHGDCFVATVAGQIAGVIVLSSADRASPISWYRETTVARIHQLVVSPSQQGRGVGRALLNAAEAWASCRKFQHLALDAPVPARRLHVYYRHRGFVLADTVQFEGRPCGSVVLTKTLHPHPSKPVPGTWPARHPAETDVLPSEASPPPAPGPAPRRPAGPSRWRTALLATWP